MPGPSGKNLPVFLGGSDLAVPVKSKAQAVAAEWINAFTGPSGQKGLIAKGNLPNNKTDLATLKNDPATAVPATAAESNWFVPMAPGWGQVEKAQVLQTHAAEHRHRQEVGRGRREGSGRRDRQGHQHQVTFRQGSCDRQGPASRTTCGLRFRTT